MSVAFRLDLNACTGCAACRIACTIENELPWGTSWRRISTFNAARVPAAPQFHLSYACYHCASAPCARARLAAEWPLLAFTLTATALVAWVLAAPAGGPPVHGESLLAAGAAGLGAALL
ncbi:MAG: hypothetical protein AB1726_02625, partial [Planctomycetota bacterium]